MTNNKIELIPIEILGENRALCDSLSAMNQRLSLSAGWHYTLDWTWTIRQIEAIEGKTILDAGAGIGFLQWYLASRGARVISVDRSNRTCIPFHLVKNFHASGLTPKDEPLSLSETLNIFNGKASIPARGKALARGILGTFTASDGAPINGNVKLYRTDLGALTEVPDESVDIVVSISALEHNADIENIKKIVQELLRILKPGGKMIVTLPASHKKDWFFEPSYAWFFTDTTIKYIFDMPENTPSNYDQYERIFDGIKDSAELKNSLSWRYYLVQNSGMPGGQWNPQYAPVGVIKTK